MKTGAGTPPRSFAYLSVGTAPVAARLKTPPNPSRPPPPPYPRVIPSAAKSRNLVAFTPTSPTGSEPQKIGPPTHIRKEGEMGLLASHLVSDHKAPTILPTYFFFSSETTGYSHNHKLRQKSPRR